jgi:hypothetical protein
MRPHRSLIAAALALLAAALLASPAPAESGRLSEFSVGLTSRAPATPTGLAVHVLFRRAEDPNAKPPALRGAVIRGPAGLRFDNGVLPQCTASDDELRTRGADACPANARLAIGSFSAMTGFGPPADPLAGDNHVFNGPSQLIEVITVPGASASPAFDRLTIDGATLTAHPPKAPGGPPDGETAVRSLDFAIPVRSAGARSLITTPPDCPADGSWATSATFTFGDGSTDTVVSRAPCTPAAALRSPRPRMSLALTPRRVTAGGRARVRFRVTSSAARCVAGARVRLVGRSARTDAAGRAALRTGFGRPGLRRAVVTHAGCTPASALVRVLSAG